VAVVVAVVDYLDIVGTDEAGTLAGCFPVPRNAAAAALLALSSQEFWLRLCLLEQEVVARWLGAQASCQVVLHQ